MSINVDELLNQSANPIPVTPVAEPEAPEETQPEKEQTENEISTEPLEETPSAPKKKVSPSSDDESPQDASDDESPSDAGKMRERNVDDYGNEIDPDSDKKLYSKTDMNRMMRERLERMKIAPAQQQQIAQEVKKDFQVDPDSEVTWEQQLEAKIEATIEKKQRDAEMRQMQQEENAKMEVFRDKFDNGRVKFKDFEDVIGKHRVTNSMFLAIREFDDPAGFIYAAAKLKPDEFKKISEMTDPYTQSAALGKLEATMKRTGKTKTNSPPPVKRVAGDGQNRQVPQKSLDNLILSDAKRKLGRR